MDELLRIQIRPERLHHAYGIEGSWSEAEPALRAIAQQLLKASIVGTLASHPDFHQEVYEVFGIDEARVLESSAHRKALLGSHKLYLLGCNSITHEAQNALLKLFEEPPQATHFFLVVPTHAGLLPTLRSRLYLVKSAVSEADTNRALARAFITASPAKRLELVASIIEEKNRVAAQSLLNGLERELHSRGWGTPHLSSAALERILAARGYISDRSSSVKLILEHVALTLPA